MAIMGGGPRPAGAVRVLGAMLVPIAVVTLAYGLWSISDRLLYSGPLDRAQFGWLVVVSIWALAPVGAAYAWRTLDRRESWIAALGIGLLLGVASAGPFWMATAFPSCEFGGVRSPAGWVLPSVVVGLMIGAGFGATCLGAAAVARRANWWVTLLTGVGSALALVFVTTSIAAPLLMGGGCQRPPL